MPSRKNRESEREVRTWTPLSLSYIFAADRFAKKSAELERQYADQGGAIVMFGTDVFEEHRGYVIGAIFSSVAFVEATINELFANAADSEVPAAIAQVSGPARSLLAELWQQGVDQQNTLLKYQTALISLGKAPFDSDRQPYQNVFLLIHLRNKLMHYKTEWSVAGLHPIERRLRGRFTENPFVPVDASNTIYPDRCLSHGCAKWSVKSSLAFVEKFHSRAGTTPNYNGHKPFETE